MKELAPGEHAPIISLRDLVLEIIFAWFPISNFLTFFTFFPYFLANLATVSYGLVHSPEEVASGPRILCWVMFFSYLSLSSLNGLVL